MAGNKYSQPPVEEKASKGRFVKGVSGNPSGVPKWVKEVKDLLSTHASTAVERVVYIMENGKTDRDRLTAAQFIIDHAIGKPVQKIGDPDGGPLAITGLSVTFVKPQPDSGISGQA